MDLRSRNLGAFSATSARDSVFGATHRKPSQLPASRLSWANPAESVGDEVHPQRQQAGSAAAPSGRDSPGLPPSRSTSWPSSPLGRVEPPRGRQLLRCLRTQSFLGGRRHVDRDGRRVPGSGRRARRLKSAWSAGPSRPTWARSWSWTMLRSFPSARRSGGGGGAGSLSAARRVDTNAEDRGLRSDGDRSPHHDGGGQSRENRTSRRDVMWCA